MVEHLAMLLIVGVSPIADLILHSTPPLVHSCHVDQTFDQGVWSFWTLHIFTTRLIRGCWTAESLISNISISGHPNNSKNLIICSSEIPNPRLHSISCTSKISMIWSFVFLQTHVFNSRLQFGGQFLQFWQKQTLGAPLKRWNSTFIWWVSSSHLRI